MELLGRNNNPLRCQHLYAKPAVPKQLKKISHKNVCFFFGVLLLATPGELFGQKQTNKNSSSCNLHGVLLSSIVQ